MKPLNQLVRFLTVKFQDKSTTSASTAVEPGLLHGNFQFARQFLCSIKPRKHITGRLFALAFKISKLSLNMKFNKICDEIFQKPAW